MSTAESRDLRYLPRLNQYHISSTYVTACSCSNNEAVTVFLSKKTSRKLSMINHLRLAKIHENQKVFPSNDLSHASRVSNLYTVHIQTALVHCVMYVHCMHVCM